ncbi:MAG: MerR family DNA-binding protein [Lysobacteraceae bacterium]
MPGEMWIGTVAARCDVSRDTIRLYEAQGLVRSRRGGQGAHGYRTYSEDDVRRVRLIRQAQTLGFSLKEIASLIDVWADRTLAPAAKRRVLAEKIGDVDRRIDALRTLRAQLAEALAGVRDDCREEDHAGEHADAPPQPRRTRRR